MKKNHLLFMALSPLWLILFVLFGPFYLLYRLVDERTYQARMSLKTR